MKKIVLILLLFALLTFCLPLVALVLPTHSPGKVSSIPIASVPKVDNTNTAPASLPEILLMDQSTGKTFTVSAQEYIMGAVAAEMPISWPDEALKAQGVAAYSYLLAQKDTAASDASLEGAYLKVNPPLRLGYVTPDVRKMIWAEQYEQNEKRLKELTDTIIGQALFFGDAPALACYHAISCGVTEASENIWRKPLDYLVSVPSTDDISAEGYEVKTDIELSKVKESLTMNFAGIKFTDTPETWFTNPILSPAGYTKEITICGLTVKGLDFRSALGLRSACFAIEYKDGIFTFTTKGYGHGAGLSQYGACSMARAGKTFPEILTHYFPGTILKNVNS